MRPGHPPSLENRPEELRGVQRSTNQWLQREEEVLQPADQMPRRHWVFGRCLVSVWLDPTPAGQLVASQLNSRILVLLSWS